MNDSLAFYTAQLRHAYSLLSSESVKDQRQFAEGLIAPIIEFMESLEHPREVVRTSKLNDADLRDLGYLR